MFMVLWGWPPTPELLHKVFNGACPLDQRALLPGGMLYRQTDGQASSVNAYRNTYDGITGLSGELESSTQPITQEKRVKLCYFT